MSDGWNLYCDESRVHDRFLAIGGLLVPERFKVEIDQAISAFRDEYSMFAELKWTKVSNYKLQQYVEFVKLVWELSQSCEAKYQVMFFDRHSRAYSKLKRSNNHTGLNAFFRESICGFLSQHGQGIYQDVKVILDGKQPANTLRALRCDVQNLVGDSYNITRVDGISSKQNDLLQYTDVLLGAISHHRISVSQQLAKIDLSQWVNEHVTESVFCSVRDYIYFR